MGGERRGLSGGGDIGDSMVIVDDFMLYKPQNNNIKIITNAPSSMVPFSRQAI